VDLCGGHQYPAIVRLLCHGLGELARLTGIEERVIEQVQGLLGPVEVRLRFPGGPCDVGLGDPMGDELVGPCGRGRLPGSITGSGTVPIVRGGAIGSGIDPFAEPGVPGCQAVARVTRSG
jgi:hypothetical protein